MTAEQYDNLPEEVKAIVDTYNDNENLYEECHRIKVELQQIGWTCDYDLSGELSDVRPNKKFKADIKFILPNGKTWYLTKEFNNRAHFDVFINKMETKKGYTMDEVWYP